MFCGIDLGTSSVKASVFDEHGRQLAFSRREIDLVLPQTGLAELDPENYLVKVYETLRDVSAQCHGNIASIAVSSQAQAVVPIDRMGNPLYNIIVTMDNRTLRQYRFWKEHHDEWEIYKRTGNGFASIYTVNKIMWFIENRPDIYEKAWKFCCVQDYVVFKLTGEGPFIDYSMAGRTMMLSSERPEWDSGVLDIAGHIKGKIVGTSQIHCHYRKGEGGHKSRIWPEPDLPGGPGRTRSGLRRSWKRRDYAGHGDGCLRHRGRNGFGSAWLYHRQGHAG